MKLRALALGACLALGCVRAPSAQDAGVDPAVHPGDDFFAYANGAWLKATAIPEGKDRVTARTEIDALTRRQIAQLFADAADAPEGSDARKLADFRAAYLDEAAIEKRALAALEPELSRIDAVRDERALARVLGASVRADVDPLNWGVYDSSHVFGLAVQPGLHAEPNQVAFLLQGGLGLGDRARYLGDDAKSAALRKTYVATIARVLALSGRDDATTRAEAVMALETALARVHATPEASAQNDANVMHRWSRAAYAERAPGLDWNVFFDAAGLAREEVIVAWQPDALVGTAALAASQPLSAWRDYLRFHALHRYVDVLPRAYAEAVGPLRTQLAGSVDERPRADRATAATERALAPVLGRVYVERHFPPASQSRVEAIAADVAAAWRVRIARDNFLSPASRRAALAKLDAMRFDVGRPATWDDTSTLRVDARDALGNALRVDAWQRQKALSRLGKPVDRREWWIAPHHAGAALIFQQTSYNFAAALLQPPKFDLADTRAANYGSIGAIFGHEMSHFVDTLGADYAPDGRKARWWTADDLAAYERGTAPLVAQYSAYRLYADGASGPSRAGRAAATHDARDIAVDGKRTLVENLAVDGKRTLVENLADLGGLAVAFDAHRKALGGDADADELRAQDRAFFIAYARAWRSELTDALAKQQLASDSHAPDRYRVATVRNLDAWYEAFDVRPTHRLYLEPAARVRVW